VLKKSRWCLLKRKEISPTAADQATRRSSYTFRACVATYLKGILPLFWEYNSPVWAGKFLDRWCGQVMRSRIEPLKEIRHARYAIIGSCCLNYFRARKEFSSGVIEDLNNKAKVTMRKAYGFRTFRADANSRSITYLANYPSQHSPTHFTDEPIF